MTRLLMDHAVDPGSKTRGERPWRVVHACDSIRSVAELIEAQIAAGMRPFVLTGEANSRTVSLIEAWARVRAWRSLLDESGEADYAREKTILHAHSFAPAMAAVRAGRTTVYDVGAFVEDYAITAGQCTERSWLTRSFRAADDFVLRRVGAVVVHGSVMRKACMDRHLEQDDVFLIPPPARPVAAADRGWLRRAFDFSGDIVTIFARPSPAEDETLIRAFAQVVAEVPGSRLFLACSAEQTAELRRFAHQLEVEDCVFFLAPGDAGPALAAADIVLAGFPVYPGESPFGRMASLSASSDGTAFAALANGCCLLAADCPDHRDLTPEGRGCLWFGAAAQTKDGAVELAHRLAFLARNADFRAALGEAARQHLTQSRDPERIGKMYGEVYAHAAMKHHRGDNAPTHSGILMPAQDCV